MKKYNITADIRVKIDLLEARDFLNSRRKGLGLKFISDYRNSISRLKINSLY
ncbi:hypothetical protein [Flavobacterium sp. PL11]|uniref:hypothetical protein n=1 Tax=Flavobacterium sp. PL11 TaxID=3071717 RepID=UPI002E1525A9